MPKAKTHIQRIMETERERVHKEWGDREKLGPLLYRALLAERLLVVSCMQDESIDPATVVRIMNEGWSWIVDEVNY